MDFEFLKKKRDKVNELNEQIKSLRAEGDCAPTTEEVKKIKERLAGLVSERDTLQAEIDDIMNEIADVINPAPAAPKEGEGEPKEGEGTMARSVEKHEVPQLRDKNFGAPDKEKHERLAKMGDDLKNRRAVTVSSGTLLVPTHDKDTIEPTFRQYSTLVDSVNQVNLMGGESYRAPYEIGVDEATAGTEGAAAAGGQETKFGYAEINKTKIVAYAELSEETKKLPSADYASRVIEGVKTAVKKRISKQIMLGDGTANNFTGIFSTAENNKCVLAADDVTVSAIDENTLVNLVGAVGGDEEIEGAICLILSKKDILAFAKLRDLATGAKIHDVDFRAQTIDGIPYFINSACKSVADASQGDYCMACGILKSYEEAIFSDIEVQESTDAKFREGMICYRAVVFAGGNTTKYRGFVRAKKGA